MKRYEILLFDADNTLFDFSLAERTAFRTAACAESLPYSDALYRNYSSVNDGLWKRLEQGEIPIDFLKLERFRILLSLLGEEDDEKAVRLRDTYESALAEQDFLIEGAEPLCRELAPDYRLYLITNGISRIQRRRFSKSAVAPYFSGIFVSEELGAQKPSRAYFDRVFSAIGNPDKSSVLVIGDSLTSDCDGAIAYGLDICRYNPARLSDEGRAITYTVTELNQLAQILNAGGSNDGSCI